MDYNPTISSVLQLVRLLQAEVESASLSVEAATPDKRACTAVMQVGGQAVEPKGPPPKAGPIGVVEAQAKVPEGSGEVKGKGKGKAKGKEGLVEVGACYNFAGGVGCKYGDACKFKHDKTAARKQKRCMACGKEGHFRSECSLVLSERRSSGEDGAQVPQVRVPLWLRQRAPFRKKPLLQRRQSCLAAACRWGGGGYGTSGSSRPRHR